MLMPRLLWLSNPCQDSMKHVIAQAQRTRAAPGDQQSVATALCGTQYHLGQALRVVHTKRSEAHVDRWGPCGRETALRFSSLS